MVLQAASSALFRTWSTPVWTVDCGLSGVYRQDAAQAFPEVSRRQNAIPQDNNMIT